MRRRNYGVKESGSKCGTSLIIPLGIADVADYIADIYNVKRLHSTLHFSPIAFERESAKQQSIDVSEKTFHHTTFVSV